MEEEWIKVREIVRVSNLIIVKLNKKKRKNKNEFK